MISKIHHVFAGGSTATRQRTSASSRGPIAHIADAAARVLAAARSHAATRQL
jgi:hypothetical protein